MRKIGGQGWYRAASLLGSSAVEDTAEGCLLGEASVVAKAHRLESLFMRVLLVFLRV